MTRAAIEYLISGVTTVEQARAVHPWLDSVLSRDEIARADRFRRASDRAAYRSAHLVFRLMAARRLGLEPEQAGRLSFTRRCRSCGGPHGKPQIPGAELSLSHSGQTIMVASAPPTSPVGADVEEIPAEVFPGFDDYVLAPAESVSPGVDPVRTRLGLWVCKEAALKATGLGLAVAPSELEVVPSTRLPSGAGGWWNAAIRAPAHEELDSLHVSPASAPPGHTAALCSAEALDVEALGLPDILTR